MTSLMDRAAASCRAATNRAFARAVRIVPMADAVNGPASPDEARAAFDTSAAFTRRAEDRREMAPDFVYGSSGMGARAIHDGWTVSARIARPAVALKTGDRLTRVDTGETFSIVGIDADDLGSLHLRLSAASGDPDV